MNKKILILTVGLVFLLATAAAAADKPKAIPISDAEPVGRPLATDACTMFKTNGTIAGYTEGWLPGYANVTFFDPSAECTGVPTYPFEIISLSFTLWNYVGAVWPVDMDFVVYGMADPQDFCAGPGTELCRETFTCDQAGFGYPTPGTITFSSPCCVNGPVFIGLKYTGTTNTPYPSILWDDQTPPCCDSWFYMDTWYDWCGAFSDPPEVGYPLFWVDGETNSANCQGEEWPNHKMHHPQLPDPTGWDVNATAPLSLADDWRCSETGWVKDIHFWGSWRSDDIGVITGFTITIHNNIPQGPGGFSIPGAPRWGPFEILDFVITPVDPPSLQGWYDPASGEIVPDEHQQYFRYDIILPETLWFEQTINDIYWLRITANVQSPTTTHWGWKNTQDHFMDDAVWASGPYDPYPPWMELYEPAEAPPDPIINGYLIAIDPLGVFLNGFGEDAYGEGWYYYPNTGWWNVWFYDHPFDPTRMKEFFAWANILPVIPGTPSMIEIAINWSTPEWPPGLPPPVPPLDPVEEQMSIGRETFYFFEGILEPGGPPAEFDFVIPNYNPEWVSMDVRGSNFVIDGVIEHTCLPQGGGEEQSLDLAFVITGEPEAEEPVYDLWETPEGYNTFVNFGCGMIGAIPADFFEPGSDPFDGTVALRGDTLNTTGDLGPTDTIVKRLRAVEFDGCGSSDEVETQIIALDLVSTEPITVTYEFGDPEQWDVKVCLSESALQPLGTTILNWICQEGGTFTAYIPVIPKFIFTRIPDGLIRVLDYGADVSPIIVQYYIYYGHWMFSDPGFNVFTSNGTEDVSNCDNYPDIPIGRSAVDLIPGLQADPCVNCNGDPDNYLIPITSLYEFYECAQHDVWPPHPPAATGACCYENGDCDEMTEAECLASGGIEYRGDGTVCLGDNNQNGIDDACEQPTGYEYIPGDVNMALGIWPPTVIGGDVTYLVGYFIGGGQAACLLDGFWASADINGDCLIIGGDVTALVGYFVAGGSITYCPDYPPAWPPVPEEAPAGWPNCDAPVLNNIEVIPTEIGK